MPGARHRHRPLQPARSGPAHRHHLGHDRADHRRLPPPRPSRASTPPTSSTTSGLVDVVRGVADRHGCTPGQVALAWVLARGDDVVPIPGTRRRRYLEENVASTSVTLDAADIARLDAFEPAGDRYVDLAAVARRLPRAFRLARPATGAMAPAVDDGATVGADQPGPTSRIAAFVLRRSPPAVSGRRFPVGRTVDSRAAGRAGRPDRRRRAPTPGAGTAGGGGRAGRGRRPARPPNHRRRPGGTR